jgi:hypothetical protein
MGESKAERIERLLSEGLEHYGMDEISSAILSWEKVLELDPQNSVALDYLRNSDRREKPRAPKQGKMASAVAALLQEARVLMHNDDYGTALDLLRSAAGPGFGGLEFEATVELVRSRLYRAYRDRMGDLARVPRLKSDAGDLTQFNLPSDAGFVLSMIDGSTPLADLISLTGMDAFEALHTLNALLDSGIVELPA